MPAFVVVFWVQDSSVGYTLLRSLHVCTSRLCVVFGMLLLDFLTRVLLRAHCDQTLKGLVLLSKYELALDVKLTIDQ